MKQFFLTSFLTILLALSQFGLSANAQPAFSFSGQVVDANAAAVPQAKVTLREIVTGKFFQTVSEPDGSFSFGGLNAGQYVLLAVGSGFAEYRQEIKITANLRNVEVVLRAAELNESVTVETKSYQTAESGTATRIPASSRDIPQNIQTVNRQILDEQAAFQLSDAVRNVSGVSRTKTAISGALGNEFTIRGFQLDIRNSYLRDGLKYSGYIVSDLAGTEQIEVLKGPASALFGRAEPGGVVNLISKKPLDSPFIAVQFTGANGGFYRPEIDLSGPLGRKISYRLNAAYQNDFSFIDFNHSRHFLLASSVLFKPAESTTLSLTAEVFQSSGVSEYGIPAVGNRPAPVPTSRFYGEPFNRYNDQPMQAGYALRHEFSPRWSLENRFSYARAGNEYLEIYPYALAADRRTVLRLADNFSFPEYSVYSQTEATGNFRTGKARHKILFGFELGWINGDFRGALANAPSIDLYQPVYGSISRDEARQALTPGSPGFFSFNTNNRVDSIAGYVQDLIDFSPKIKLLVGARIDRYKQKSDDRNFNSVSRLTDTAISPRVGIVFAPVESTSLYFSFVRSFTPQSPTALNRAGTTFKPSHAQQYEVGIKRAFFESKIAATVSAYWIERTNVLTADPSDPRFSVQTGTQRSKGIDADVAGQILPGWNVWTAYAFNQAQIIADNTFPVGNFLPEAPRHSGNVWTTYEFSRGRIRGFGFGGGIYALSAKQGDLYNSYRLPGYARVDATAYYEFRRGAERKAGWRLSVNIKNALDRKYWEASNSGFVRAGSLLAVYTTFKWIWN